MIPGTGHTIQVTPLTLVSGTPLAAPLFLIGKISQVKYGSRVLRNMRQSEVVVWILDLIEMAVAGIQNAGSGTQAQTNIHPHDFRDDAEADEDAVQKDQTFNIQVPQDSFKKEGSCYTKAKGKKSWWSGPGAYAPNTLEILYYL